jgi:ADP-heptose:LPS heptosyltransferase
MLKKPALPQKNLKRLIIRLSSLGDVVLSTSVLGGLSLGERVDWLTSQEYVGLLEGHPSIARVWPFDRRGGLRAWIHLCRDLWSSGYDEVLDLHCSLRTRIARLLFLGWSLRHGRPGPGWRVLRKGRLKRWAQFWLKGWFPTGWRPRPWVEAYSAFLAGDGGHRPDLRNLARTEIPLTLPKAPFLAVMPATRWPAKEWPPERFAEWLRARPEVPVVLGTPTDAGSLRLVELLSASGREHLSAVGKLNLPQTAAVLARAKAFVGGDTGLAHLAEAVGTPAWVLFGPTVPEMGFGPWRPESLSLGRDLWCRPCGKDGRYCYRPLKRYHCLRGLGVAEVERGLQR